MPVSCPANVRETRIAWGKVTQADIATPNVSADLVSMTKVNPALATLSPVNETDAQDIGKGNEFPSNVFPSNLDGTVPVEKYASSEFLAWLFCWTTGKATKTAAGSGFKYDAVPSDPVTDCINLPVFTYVEQIRPEPDSVVDRALVSCVVGDFTLTMASGPGRANCRVTTNWPSSGRFVLPSALTIPALTVENLLNAAGAAITIGGVDYVLAKSFISLEFRWNNNVRLDTGIFPGSGTQNGYAVRGRMEYGNRDIALSFVARAALGSVEFTNLMNQTENPATFGVTGATVAGVTHSFQVTMPRTRMLSVIEGEDNGIVTVNCSVVPLNPTGVTPPPIITMSATTDLDGILGL
jgi:hypothetical protein